MEPKPHAYYMNMALREAETAGTEGEVPVGAVIVQNDKVIGRAHNQVELLKDPTAHAEMIAITQAASAGGDWRLNDTILYVTKEPCPMCAGAIVQARIGTLVFAVEDPLRGGAVSVFDICTNVQMNHHPAIVRGIMENECREMLQAFFRKRRQDEA